MSQLNRNSGVRKIVLPRRRALALAGVAAATVAAAGPLGIVTASAQGTTPSTPTKTSTASRNWAGQTTLPVDQMMNILQAQGTVNGGVLSIELDRTDIGTVQLNGTPISPSFEINGSLNFQPLANGQAFFNGDMALKPQEIDPFIDAILGNGLIFQAEHQHFYDFNPIVWFIHWRGQGDPISLATAVHNTIKATSTPLPQIPPSNPTTPLDPDKLKSILHGYDVEVGGDGVVTVYVARKNSVFIDGVLVQPQTNIATNIPFEPLSSDGSKTAAAPDFGMVADEVNPVMKVMRGMGWDIGCLYNQETDENPQLFFSHQFKTGDPYKLASEIRMGLNQMNVQ